MVESEQVQDTVNQKLIKPGFCRHSCLLSFPGRRVKRNDYIAQEPRSDIAEGALLHGESHDIGGTGPIQVRPVQLCHFLIGYNEDR